MFRILRDHWLIIAVWILCLLGILAMTNGCASHIPKPGPGGGSHGPGSTPKSLSQFATGLDWLMLLAVPLIAGGIAMVFFAPVAHRLSFAIVTAGGALLGVSLLIRVSLWLVPWIAGALLIGGLLFAGYEVYRKYHAKTPA